MNPSTAGEHKPFLKQTKHFSLEQFLDQVVMAFSDAEKWNYNAIDIKVNEMLTKLFLKQMSL